MKHIVLLGILIFGFNSTFFSQSSKYKDSLINIIKTKTDTNKVNSLVNLSEELTYSNTDTAIALAKQGLKLAEKLKFEIGCSRAYTRLGILFNLTAKEDSAIYFLKKAKQISTTNKNYKSLAAINNNLAMSYFDKSEHDVALGLYFEGLKHAENAHDTNLITSVLNNIANLHFTLKNVDKALEYHKQSLSYARKLKNKFKIASSLNNIGICYRDRKNPDTALLYFEESLALAKEMQNKVGISLLMNNIGGVYRQEKQFDLALQFFAQALELKKEIHDVRGEAHAYGNMADVYFMQFKYDDAIKCALKSIEAGKIAKNKDIQYSSYHVLADAYAAKKQYEKAFIYHKLYSAFKDSVFDLQKNEQMQELNSKYESEKKDQEIKFLNKDKALQDATIAKQNADAEKQSTVRTAMLIGLFLVALLAVFIFRSNRIKNRANKELSEKNLLIEEQKQVLQVKQKEIVDSIQYAKRIQDALLAHTDIVKSFIPEHFIFFQPKDIISGDFYWASFANRVSHETSSMTQASDANSKNDLFYLAVCDSTGHGVPGAFMSLLNINFLNEAIIEKKIEEPGKIFDYVRERLIASISKEEQKDGFDGILICYNKSTNKITYSAANNKPVLIRNNMLVDMNSNRMPVGKGERTDHFETFNTDIQKGDQLYLYSDGFGDQFGGPKGKKFKHKQLNQLILKNHHLPMPQQSDVLKDAFTTWKGNLEQIDDVCIMGLRF